MDDRTLHLLTSLDWVTPTTARVQDLIHGGGRTFILARLPSAQDTTVQETLARYGIESWGLITLDEALLITVPPAKAAWAENRLRHHGHTILHGALTAGGGRPGLDGIVAALRSVWREFIGL